jgi:hypothetical protein
MLGILLWALGPFRRFLRGVLCGIASLRPLLSADLGNQPRHAVTLGRALARSPRFPRGRRRLA